MKEIRADRRLLSIFMKYVRSSEADKKLFEFVRYQDTGRLDIIDRRPLGHPLMPKAS